jgi:peptide/nickel transport system permease protein
MRRRPKLWVGLVVVAVLVALATVGDALSPWAATVRDPTARDAAPSAQHLLGTDRLGFDMLAQVLRALRTSLVVGLVTSVLVTTIGTAVGLFAGYVGGIADAVVMRLADLVLAFPGLVLALAAVALLGPDMRNVVLVMTLLLWPMTARLIRSRVLSVRAWPFVDAAHALGAGSWRIAIRHVLPQVAGTAVTAATLTTAGAILIEANLSFLGLSDPTLPSLGKLLASAQSQRVLATRWWLWIPPGIALVGLILGLYLVGDGLRDRLARQP